MMNKTKRFETEVKPFDDGEGGIAFGKYSVGRVTGMTGWVVLHHCGQEAHDLCIVSPMWGFSRKGEAMTKAQAESAKG